MLSPLVGLGATALAATGLLTSLIPEHLLQSTRTAAPPRNSSGELLSPAVDAFIRETMGLWELKGLSIAVVRKRADGSGLFDVATRGYGVAGRDGRPVTTKTLFPIGSNSKAFAVAAVGHLVANDSINLDWTSAKLVPACELSRDSVRLVGVQSIQAVQAKGPRSFRWSSLVELVKRGKLDRA